MTTEIEPTTTDEVVRPRARGWIHRISYLVAWPATLLLVAIAPTWPARLSVAVYGATLLTVFWVSSTYHRGSWTAEEFARWQRRDHAAIFLLIAGSYTPYCVLALEGSWRVWMLVAVWTVAGLGILMKLYRVDLHVLSGIMYLGLGWAAVIVFPQFVRALGPAPLDPHRGRRAPLFARSALPRDASTEALPANLRLPRGVARGHRGGRRLSLRGRAPDGDRGVTRGAQPIGWARFSAVSSEIPSRSARSGVFWSRSLRTDSLDNPSSSRICSGVRPAWMARSQLFLDHLLTSLGDLLEQDELLDLFAEQVDVRRVAFHRISPTRT